MLNIGDFYILKEMASEEQISEIATISGDRNPVHLNHEYASQSIFGKPIAHGLFCINMISNILGNYLPGPGTILLSQKFEYCKPVYIGDVIEAKVTVSKVEIEKNRYTLDICCNNQDKCVVLKGKSIVKYEKYSFTLSEYESVIEGKLLRDGKFQTLEYCTSVCDDQFLTFLENPKYISKLNAKVSCLITTEEIADHLPGFKGGIWIAAEPKKEFVKLHNFLADDLHYARLSFETVIGQNCKISPLAVIAKDNVVLGDNVEIGDYTVINENVTIGNACIIHENCVVGGKSFNFAKTKDGKMLGMKDLGEVVLGERVEICPLCHIANAPLPTDRTELDDDVKLDAMVHVGHGTRIGKGTEIPAGAQIAGNCVIGQNAWVGVNATVSNRIHIGDNARISLGSVVTKDVKDDQTVTGNFAIEHSRFIEELKQINKKYKMREQE